MMPLVSDIDTYLGLGKEQYICRLGQANHTLDR